MSDTETHEAPEDEEHEEPVCPRCGFEGYVVACIYKGQEGCQLTYPPKEQAE